MLIGVSFLNSNIHELTSKSPVIISSNTSINSSTIISSSSSSSLSLGDMQLTRAEIAETQVIVTTPEKWDVITRKGGDNSLVEKVKLLILDEVHLLASDRGNVLESITARTLRQVGT